MTQYFEGNVLGSEAYQQPSFTLDKPKSIGESKCVCGGDNCILSQRLILSCKNILTKQNKTRIKKQRLGK